MNSAPVEFAQFRSWAWEGTHPLSQTPALDGAWRRTAATLGRLRELFAGDGLPPEVRTLYVCGSLGRMEQLPHSDCDLVIVTDDSVREDAVRRQAIHQAVWGRLGEVDVERPKADGIFGTTVCVGELADPTTRGVVDEDQAVFGKRIQLLLDSQPVFGDGAFVELAAAVLERYAFPQADRLGQSRWAPLLYDLSRYFRALSIRTLWLPEDRPGTWRVLNLKLRFSRLVLYAGLLLLLVENFDGDGGRLLSQLGWTPLERIGFAFEGSDGVGLGEILESYDAFLGFLGDGSRLEALADDGRVAAMEEEFGALMVRSEGVCRRLTERLLADAAGEFLRQVLFL